MTVYSRGSGPKRNRITLQSSTEAADPYGQRQQTWADVRTLWCAIESADPGLTENADQTKGRNNGVITMRYFGEFDETTHRFKLGDRILHIDGKEDVGNRHKEYVIDYHELIGTAAL